VQQAQQAHPLVDKEPMPSLKHVRGVVIDNDGQDCLRKDGCDTSGKSRPSKNVDRATCVALKTINCLSKAHLDQYVMSDHLLGYERTILER
jgi:hypothetical protein